VYIHLSASARDSQAPGDLFSVLCAAEHKAAEDGSHGRGSARAGAAALLRLRPRQNVTTRVHSPTAAVAAVAAAAVSHWTTHTSSARPSRSAPAAAHPPLSHPPSPPPVPWWGIAQSGSEFKP
jgi:hypothetical protein